MLGSIYKESITGFDEMRLRVRWSNEGAKHTDRFRLKRKILEIDVLHLDSEDFING